MCFLINLIIFPVAVFFLQRQPLPKRLLSLSCVRMGSSLMLSINRWDAFKVPQVDLIQGLES